MANRGEGKAYLVVLLDAAQEITYDQHFTQGVLKAEEDITKDEFTEMRDIKKLWTPIQAN